MRHLPDTVARATDSAADTVVLLSANPMHDTGGGQRSAQLALELLERGRAVVFVSHGRVTEREDLNLSFRHERLVETSLRAFSGRSGQRAREVIARSGVSLLVTQVPVRGWLPVIDWARSLGAVTVYDCVDRWDSELGQGWYRPEAERRVAARSDLLTASAPELVEHLERLAEREALLLPNAYNDRVFSRAAGHARPRDLPVGRTALYVGALWGGWMDWDLVACTARAHPGTTLVFIGDRKGVPDDLPRNCVFLGLKPQTELPAYLEHAEVAVLPWRPDPVTRATSPLKVYEFVAMGLPVVAPALEPVSGIPGVFPSDGRGSFTEAVGRVGRTGLANETRETMRAFAAANTWRARVDTLHREAESLRARSGNAFRPGGLARPAISVVIPAYNHERYVARALESARDQTLPASEIVVVDDGSSDGTRAVLEKLGGPDVRVYGQTNRGAHAAINRGVALARGEYVAILNSDDVFAPERLEHAWGLVRGTGAALVLGGVEWVDGDEAPLPSDHEVVAWYREALAEAGRQRSLFRAVMRHNVAVTTSNFFMHRGLWRALGGFRAYRYVHDLEFLLRALELCPDRVLFEPSMVTVGYRMHGENTISESAERAFAERRDAIRAVRRGWDRVRRRVGRRPARRSLAVAVRSAQGAGVVEPRPGPGPALPVGLVTRDLDHGGLEETVALLAQHLPAQGVRPHVLCTHGGGAVAERLSRAGVDVHVARGRPGGWTGWARDTGIRVASTHFSDPEVIEAFAEAGVPVVETVQNAYAWLDDQGWDRERRKARALSATIAVSELVARFHACRLGGRPTSLVVPNAVGRSRAAETPGAWARARLGLEPRHRLFVTHGRLARQKNLPGLVRAFAPVARSSPDVLLWIFGFRGERGRTGEIRAQAPDLFRKGRIRILEPVDAVGTFLSAADVFVSNSFFEGWSLAASEAAWTGLPLVLSECGGSRELVGPDERWGRLVPNPLGDPMMVGPANVETPPTHALEANERALEAALSEVAADLPAWRARRPEIRARARSELAPERLARRYAEIFRQLDGGAS